MTLASTKSESRISRTFARQTKAGEDGALIAYTMGGDPSLEISEDVVDALIEGGADMVEIGIPFSDPMADGASIQRAAVRSLTGGSRPDDILKLIGRIRNRHPDTPILVMTYYNILLAGGLDSFLRRARSVGVDGLIVPDLPLDEAAEYAGLAHDAGLDTVLLAAPTTSPERMRSLATTTTGFLYLVSVLGVTGARSDLRKSTVDLIGFARRFTREKVPLAVGFGISTPQQVRTVIEAGADAAIVGSAIVDRVAECSGNRERAEVDAALQELKEYVGSLKSGTIDARKGRRRTRSVP